MDAVAALFNGSAIELSAPQRERLVLVVNILRRLDVRFHGDDRAIRLALQTPSACLGGVTPTVAMAGDLSALRQVRHAVIELSRARVRYWRIGHNRE